MFPGGRQFRLPRNTLNTLVCGRCANLTALTVSPFSPSFFFSTGRQACPARCLHAPRLRADLARRPVGRVLLPVPRLPLRHLGPHPQGARPGEPLRPQVQVSATADAARCLLLPPPRYTVLALTPWNSTTRDSRRCVSPLSPFRPAGSRRTTSSSSDKVAQSHK